MWGRARAVSVDNGAMTLETAAPLVAVSVLVWVMIVLPIVLLAGIGIAYLVNRGRSGA
jgi:ABC-type sugar transport system permease subunit